MAEPNRQKDIKTIGIYIILILALVRFFIYPLHAAVEGKKLMLGEQYESYRAKYRLLERQKENGGRRTAVERTALFPYLYDRKVSRSYMQTDILERLVKLAEKKGMTVVNFEMLEAMAEKEISEVPVLARLKGRPKAFVELLEAMETGEKALNVKSLEISRSGQDLIFSLTLSAFRTEK